MTVHDTVTAPGGVALECDLRTPPAARGVVLFAHGSGSSRHSPRNLAVASSLEFSGLATALPDLLTEDEARTDTVTSEHRFDIPLLSERLTAAVDWLGRHTATQDVPLHLFGASTGAAAALMAATRRPDRVQSVVSRGGRPDLAGDALPRVTAPVLLLVGSLDTEVLRLNREAAARMTAPCRVRVIPGATHLFEEPGTLEQVTAAARDWFLDPGARAAEEAT